ncbi:MAG: FG-GAP-like repeat-containing protein [Nonlabens sp.]
MKYVFTLAILCLSGILVAQDGSSCGQAIPISLGMHSTMGYTAPPLTSVCVRNINDVGNSTLWYRFTATNTTGLKISSRIAGQPNVDTKLHVFEDNCSTLTCIGGDDDSGGSLTSELVFSTIAGESYLIAWDNYWSSNDFSFTLEEVTAVTSNFTFTSANLNLSGSNRAAVDMNGDGLDDLISVSSNQISIHYQRSGGGFDKVDIGTTTATNTPSWSLAAADYDKNGFTDLLYGGGSGVTFMQANNTGTGFTQISGPEYVFSQRSNFVDLNNDGDLDAFVCHDVQPNVYYINDGNNNLEFFQGADPNGIPTGLGLVPNGGNYGTVWIDYDNDLDMDLFIAKCRGGSSAANINELHRNNGDGTFTNVAADPGVNLADDIQTWSSAWGDYDNDGDMDGFIGASSTANGSHKMMRNNGDGTFTDITSSMGPDISALGTGIENTPADFDNDGNIDILSNGSIMRNNGDGTFTLYDNFGIPSSGALGDLNDDGYLDIFNSGNLYYNTPGINNWLKITLEGTQSNANGIGARVEVTTSGIGMQIRDVRSGEGFRYMSSLNAHFGLGLEAVADVTVKWPSGQVTNLQGVSANQHLIINETTTNSTPDLEDTVIRIFPNPATDVLKVVSPIDLEATTYRIVNLNGQAVTTGKLSEATIDVSGLPSGMYFLSLEINGEAQTRKFIKK